MPSAIPLEDAPVPHAMTVEEIKAMVQDLTKAARNTMEASFDGVKFDGNNGLLHDQFV